MPARLLCDSLCTWLAASQLLTQLAAPAPATEVTEAATPAASPSHWDLADDYAARGLHEEAAQEYALAYDEHGAPAILYSWAQAERLRGRCDEALPLYERFVAAAEITPPEYDAPGLREQWANMRVNAERQRGVCREAVRAIKAPAVPAAKPTTLPSTQPTPERTAPDRTAPSRPTWRRDAAGWSLFATGLAAAAVGAGLLGAAAATDGDAASQPDHQRFRDAIARAQLEQRAGIGVLAAGGALLLGGVVRLAIVAARARKARPVAARTRP